ncbi:hypothetical protein TSMEX_002980 [Taenia solium]|eukprot:TsM_000337700 transcript=TsM_000337700 gene=TsM_000337700
MASSRHNNSKNSFDSRVYRRIKSCTKGANGKLPQCTPSYQFISHFCSYEDQQCLFCEPMWYAIEKRFYSVLRKVNAVRPMEIAGVPNLPGIQFPGIRSAIQRVKRFENDVRTKANAIDKYECPTARHANSRGRLLEEYPLPLEFLPVATREDLIASLGVICILAIYLAKLFPRGSSLTLKLFKS